MRLFRVDVHFVKSVELLQKIGCIIIGYPEYKGGQNEEHTTDIWATSSHKHYHNCISRPKHGAVRTIPSYSTQYFDCTEPEVKTFLSNKYPKGHAGNGIKYSSEVEIINHVSKFPDDAIHTLTVINMFS